MSCKKDAIELPNTSVESGANPYYSPTVGSYWVLGFQNYDLDSNLVNPGVINFYDTIFVQRDTIDNGNDFKVFSAQWPSYYEYLLRDSSGFVVNENGTIILAPFPFGDYKLYEYEGYDSFGNLRRYHTRFPRKEVVNFPVGEYECLRVEKYKLHELAGYEGTSVDYWSEIGPVQRTIAYLSGAYMIGKLVDYHIE